jgi:hypothetical protein
MEHLFALDTEQVFVVVWNTCSIRTTAKCQT